MKKLLVIITLLGGSQNLMSQPGYMGRKHVVSIEAHINPVNTFTAGYGLMKQYSVQFEKASSEKASWIAGASAGFNWMSPIDIEHYRYMVSFELSHSNGYEMDYIRPEGNLAYGFQELSLQRRWYAGSIGAVAPYGVYVGLQTDFSRLKQYDSEMKYFSEDLDEYISFRKETPRAHSAISEVLIIGNRRMIANRLTFASQVGVGVMLWQSSRPALITENSVSNYMDFEENVMVRHFASSKLLKLGFQIGYIF